MIIPHNNGDAGFKSLSSAIKSLIEGLAPAHVYPATLELYRQGSPTDEVYFINRGLLKLVRMERDGHEIIIDLRPRGWLLGTAAVITRQPHPVTAITLSDSVVQRIPVLRRSGDEQSYTIPNLTAEKEDGKSVRVRLPNHILTRGNYQVELRGVAADGSKSPPEIYSFTISE